MKRLLQQAILLAVLLLPAVLKAQYTYTVVNGKTTITDYTGTGGAVTIPGTLGGGTVTSIGDDAFWGCDGLTSITIPSSVTNIGDGAFADCASLTNIAVNVSNPNYSSASGVLFNKDQSILLQIPGGKAGNYTIPSSVTNVADYAFFYSSLNNITIPNSVASIGYDQFAVSTNLTNITVSVSNLNYCSVSGVLFSKDQGTLFNFPGGKAGTYTVPSSVTRIGFGAFSECDGLTSIMLPDSVTSIGDWAFGNCANLTNVTILGSVANIGADTFYYCTSLTNITLPIGVTNIADGAFWNTGLTSVMIPSSVTSIGQNAFGCPINSVYFNGNAPSVDGQVFWSGPTINYLIGTTGWTNPWCGLSTTGNVGVTVADILSPSQGGIVIGGGAFWPGANIQLTAVASNDWLFVGWSDGVTNNPRIVTVSTNSIYIALFMFLPCTWTTNSGSITITGYTDSGGTVTIPSTINGLPVTSIDVNAFLGCSALTNIMIPASVTNIGNYAFLSCTSLTNVYFFGAAPTLGSYVFFGDSSAVAYYVPDTAGWDTFTGCAAVPNPNYNQLAVTFGTGEGYYTNGQVVAISAVVSNGYPFACWIGDTQYLASTTSSITTVTMPFSSIALSATYFGQPAFTVVSGYGSPVPSVGSQTNVHGTILTCSVVSPVPGGATQYVCTGWSMTGNDPAYGTATNFSLTLTNDATLTWNWQTQYLLTTITNGNGSVTAGGWFNAGSNVTVTATPAAHDRFTGWTGDTNGCVLAGVVATASMTRARNLTATFALALQTLTVVSAQGGSTPCTTVDYGTGMSQWVTNSPVIIGSTQYVCTGASVSGNTCAQNNPTNITLTLTNDATLTWNWQTRYLLTTGTNGNGSVTTGGWFIAGSNATLTATPDVNWHFAGWSGDTNGFAAVGNVATASMTQARSIVAAFVPFTFTSDGTGITITAYTGGRSVEAISSTVNGLPVTGIAGYAFLGCIGLSSVALPAGVTNIGNYAFFNCANLSNIYFRGNAPTLGTFAFSGGTPATVYYLPNTTGWDTFGYSPAVLWDPQIQQGAAFGVQANCFGFTITNAGSPTIVVEARSNLLSGVWTPVSTNTLTGGSSYFGDPDWTNYPGRFYRFRSP